MTYERYNDGEIYGTEGDFVAWFIRQPDRSWKWSLTRDSDPMFHDSSFRRGLRLRDAKADVLDAIERANTP